MSETTITPPKDVYELSDVECDEICRQAYLGESDSVELLDGYRSFSKTKPTNYCPTEDREYRYFEAAEFDWQGLADGMREDKFDSVADIPVEISAELTEWLSYWLRQCAICEG